MHHGRGDRRLDEESTFSRVMAAFSEEKGIDAATGRRVRICDEDL